MSDSHSSSPEYRQKPPVDSRVQRIVDEISNLKMLKDLETREIAAEHGYADVVAQKASRMKIDSLLQAFFVEVKHIEKKLIRSDDWSAVQPDFYLLKHRLELVKKRQYVPVEFDQVVLAAMSRIERGGPTDYKDNFLKFAQFLNAFVAYFTFYWGDRTGN